MGARTIYLLQTISGQWLIRVAAAQQRIVSEEYVPTPAAALKAFITEGRHQCFAHMVVIVEGQRPITIRAGKNAPEHDDEPKLLARVREAMQVP